MDNRFPYACALPSHSSALGNFATLLACCRLPVSRNGPPKAIMVAL